ncbi:uncharacterized protein LOC127129914 [Lathyrus oleraceus]|uniref:uncharacterized protein LOC127129914 n=1 Tax=Pisum sativum TaxID=3888 RepID=UPI0021D35556|nr:uncharacterized protein LOC127129914 [Pisum sativum]
MAGRNYCTIADALKVMAHANQALQNQNLMADEFRRLSKFQRNNQPTFKGMCDLEVKFEELSRFCLHYNGVGAKGLSVSSLRVVYIQRSRNSSDSRTRSTHYKSISEKKSGNQNYGKPYGVPIDKRKWKASCGKDIGRRDTSASVICFSCGGMGHRVGECKSSGQKCFKCGKSGHCIADFKSNMLTCFNCGEPDHISTHF